MPLESFSSRLWKHRRRVEDSSSLVGVTAALAEADPTVISVTLITPDGHTTYVDAATLRRGGRA
jgi:hypothetical protein